MTLVFEHLQNSHSNYLRKDVAAFYITPQKDIHLIIGKNLTPQVITPSKTTASDIAAEIKSFANTFILIAPQHYVLNDHNAAHFINDLVFLDEVCYALHHDHKKNIFVHTSVFFAYIRMNHNALEKKYLYDFLIELLNEQQVTLSNGAKISWFKFFTQKQNLHNPISKDNQPLHFIYDAPIMNNCDIFSCTHLTPISQKQKIGFYFLEEMIVNCHYPILDVENSYPAYKITEALHFYTRLVKWHKIEKFNFSCYIGDIYIGDSVFGYVECHQKTFGNVEPIRNEFRLPVNLKEITIQNIKGEAHIGEAAFFLEDSIQRAHLWVEIQTLHLTAITYTGNGAFESNILYCHNTAWSNVKTLLLPNVKLINSSFRSFGKQKNTAWQNLTCLILNGGGAISFHCHHEAFKSESHECNHAFESLSCIKFTNTNYGQLTKEHLNLSFQNAKWLGHIKKGPWDEVDFIDFSSVQLCFHDNKWQDQDTANINIDFPPVLITREDDTIEIHGTLKNHNPPTKLSILTYNNSQVIFCNEVIVYQSTFSISENAGQTERLTFDFEVIDSACNYGKINNVNAFIDLTPPEISCFSIQVSNPQPQIFGLINDNGIIDNVVVEISNTNFSKSFSLLQNTVEVSNGIWQVNLAKNKIVLASGSYQVTVSAKDKALNQSVCTTKIEINPNLPNFDFIPVPFPTNSSSVLLQGCLEIGTILQIAIDQEPKSNVSLDSNNCFTFVTNPLSIGAHVALFYLTKNGVTSTFAYFIAVDPNAQNFSITSIVPGSTTNQSHITLEGKVADPLSSVVVNGKNATINLDGTFSIDLSLVEGSNLIEVITIDSKGFIMSYSFLIYLDTVSPSTPLVTQIFDENNNIILNNGFIKSNQITLAGTTDPKTKIILFNGNIKLAETVSDALGKWSITIDNLIEGFYDLNISAVDKASNTSNSGSFITFTIDLTPPVLPTIENIDGTLNFITISQTPIISGTYDKTQTTLLTVEITQLPNNLTQIYTSSNNIITNPTDGTWKLTIPDAKKLNIADYLIKISTQDVAGNNATFQTNFSVCEFKFTIIPVTSVDTIELQLLLNCSPDVVTFLDADICTPIIDLLGGIEGKNYSLILPDSCINDLPKNNFGFPMLRISFKYGDIIKITDQIQIS